MIIVYSTDMQEKTMAKLRGLARPAARPKCDAGFTWSRLENIRFKIHICRYIGHEKSQPKQALQLVNIAVSFMVVQLKIAKAI